MLGEMAVDVAADLRPGLVGVNGQRRAFCCGLSKNGAGPGKSRQQGDNCGEEGMVVSHGQAVYHDKVAR